MFSKKIINELLTLCVRLIGWLYLMIWIAWIVWYFGFADRNETNHVFLMTWKRLNFLNPELIVLGVCCLIFIIYELDKKEKLKAKYKKFHMKGWD